VFQVSQLSRELARGLQQLARALLNTEELAGVTAEHPTDPFRLQVRILDRDSSGEHPRALFKAVDPDSVNIDPLTHM